MCMKALVLMVVVVVVEVVWMCVRASVSVRELACVRVCERIYVCACERARA